MRDVEEFEINRMGKFIDQEMDFNRRLIKEEELCVERVIEDYAKLIRENDISVFFLLAVKVKSNNLIENCI